MDMAPVSRCSMSSCAYNLAGLCHTLAINVGPHAECNTFTHASPRGGFEEAEAGIGACLAANCRYNDRLECRASDIDVAGHERHADCGRYSPFK